MKDQIHMTSQTDNGPVGQQLEDAYDITLLDYIELLIKHKRLIGKLTGAAFIISLVISLLLPARYVAKARVLPPKESDNSMNTLLTHTEGVLGGLSESLLSSKTPSELYVGILKSRSAADELIQRFNLKKLYGFFYIEDVYNKLSERTDIQVDKKNQIITVAVEDSSPQRAADMANFYVDALDRINRKLNISEGQKKRQFLEERLTKVQSDLSKAENALKEFQERHKLMSLEEQAKSAIKAAAEIKGELIAAETNLEVQRQFGTQRQNEAVMLIAKIDELKRQLAKIEFGQPANDTERRGSKINESDLFIPIGSMPDLGLKLAQLTRDAKTQEKVFELITTQFELAKMEEAKDVNTVQVLDRAVPPERRSFPKRSSIVILWTLTALFCGVVLAFLKDYLVRLQKLKPDQYESIKAVFSLKDRFKSQS